MNEWMNREYNNTVDCCSMDGILCGLTKSPTGGVRNSQSHFCIKNPQKVYMYKFATVDKLQRLLLILFIIYGACNERSLNVFSELQIMMENRELLNCNTQNDRHTDIQDRFVCIYIFVQISTIYITYSININHTENKISGPTAQRDCKHICSIKTYISTKRKPMLSLFFFR